jgi:hypothetical protein
LTISKVIAPEYGQRFDSTVPKPPEPRRENSAAPFFRQSRSGNWALGKRVASCRLGSLRLTQHPFFHSFCFVRRLKCCLSWALTVLMFAVALVPANGLTVLHAHDDHAESADHDHDHSGGVLAFDSISHMPGAHEAEGLHAHQIGWQQMQKSSGVREIGAPVLVTQVWLHLLASFAPAHRAVDVPPASPKAKTVHAPPPLLRSMAFLI